MIVDVVVVCRFTVFYQMSSNIMPALLECKALHELHMNDMVIDKNENGFRQRRYGRFPLL